MIQFDQYFANRWLNHHLVDIVIAFVSRFFEDQWIYKDIVGRQMDSVYCPLQRRDKYQDEVPIVASIHHWFMTIKTHISYHIYIYII